MTTKVKGLFLVACAVLGCLLAEMPVFGSSEAKLPKIEDQIASFVSLLEEKINSRDIDAVRALFLPQATNCVPRLPKGKSDSLRLEVARVEVSTNISVDVCSYQVGRPNRKQIVHMEFAQTENGLRIRSAVDNAAARRNAEFDLAVIAARRFALAINRLDTNEVCRLTGIPESVRQGGGRMIATNLEKRNMGWVAEAMRQKFRIEYGGVGRLADDDLRARLRELGAGGVTNAVRVLQFRGDHFTHGEKDL